MTNSQELITAWRDADIAAKEAVKRERELRAQIIEAFSERTDEMTSGVENVDVGWGYDLKITHKLTYTLNNHNDYEQVDLVADAIEQMLGSEFGENVINRLFKRKFDLSVSEYNKLTDLPDGAKIKALVDRILTIKPASKAVELKQRGK